VESPEWTESSLSEHYSDGSAMIMREETSSAAGAQSESEEHALLVRG